MRTISSRMDTRRRGVVLLVVMAMLALFASLALSFVFYADAEAVASQLQCDSMAQPRPDIDPELLAAYFLGQLIYDTDNPYSALRGWSLARSMYGHNFDPKNPGAPSPNFTPYNGIGRSSLSYVDPLYNVDNFTLVNYQNFTDPADPNTNLQRRPEWIGYGNPPAGTPSPAPFRYLGGANAPWTAYDTNSMFLAAVKADGTVLLPSFSRPWNQTGHGGATKYQQLSPDAAWNPAFTTPDQDLPGGPHVKNLEFSPGSATVLGQSNNDSYWLDLGFPIMTAPNGIRYKPLFAPLVVDLSNRLHLWAHGNRLGAGSTHVSNQGHGATEVNLLNGLSAAILPPPSAGNPPGASMVGSAVTINTWSPHGFTANQQVTISGVANAGYNGTFVIAHVPSATSFQVRSAFSHLPPSGSGFVCPTAMIAEVQQALFNLKYGGVGSPSTAMAVPPTAMGIPGGFAAQLPGGAWQFRKGNWYSYLDADGLDPVSNTSTLPMSLPPANSFLAFPSYTAGYNNVFDSGAGPANVNEITNSPLALNLFQPIAPNIGPLPASHMEALLRHGGTNSPALTSEIFRRMPTTFSNVRARNMVTTTNWSLDRIAASPYITYDPRVQGTYYLYNNLVQAGTSQAYAVGPLMYPQPPNFSNATPPPANSEFTSDWRGNLGRRLRVNLNRPLADYPPLTNGVFDLTQAGAASQFLRAQTDRQDLAADIYNALVQATGACDPNKVAGMAAVNTDYQAARWLAQIAVNLVDYIDNDDIATPFNWNAAAAAVPHGGIASEWLFGTELPRLVLNEVYGQLDNDPSDPGIAKPTKTPKATYLNLNVWAELHNPFIGTPATDAYPLHQGIAYLELHGNAIYQMQVCQSSPALTAYLSAPGNNLGNVAPFGPSTLNRWGTSATTQMVHPANGAYADPTQSNRGFYVAGPAPRQAKRPLFLPGHNPQLPTTLMTPALSVQIANPNTASTKMTILLQRLACPYLPLQPNPSVPRYNPYITVDFVDKIPVNNNLAYTGTGPVLPAPTPAQFRSNGRIEPYAASTTTSGSFLANGNQTNAAVRRGQPQNTFFSHNSNIPQKTSGRGFTWLVHLDRPPVNAIELLHVSGFPPHQLTQQFVAPPNQYNANAYFGHCAPWNPFIAGAAAQQWYVGPSSNSYPQTNTLLYRALDLLSTSNHMPGTIPGGRWPGSVNLNTVTEPEIFLALCDWNPNNTAHGPHNAFTAADLQSVWNLLLTARTGNSSANVQPGMQVPSGEGKPFKSFANSNYQGSGNFGDTWFRWNPIQSAQGNYLPIFVPQSGTSSHPYLQAALLQKIYNHITATSNVFAVWWTVGYFQVVDETVRPARLGPEIGRSQNRHLRHRFFAVVDRSALNLFETRVAPNTFVAAGRRQTMTVADFKGQLANGQVWSIQPGMLLNIDFGGPSAEVVAVQSVIPPVGNSTRGSFTANFAFSHAAGATVSCGGNPGPQPIYNPRADNQVVLHTSVIQ